MVSNGTVKVARIADKTNDLPRQFRIAIENPAKEHRNSEASTVVPVIKREFATNNPTGAR